jgi:LemA protein
MSTGKIILIVLAVLAIMCGGAFIGQFNEIRTLENGVQVSWANVENQYQRRYDLIPNIVETVKGEANFEKSTLTEVIEARSKMGGVIKMDDKMLGDERAMKRFQEAQNSLGGALQRH